MVINCVRSLPPEVTVAVSGGIDSVVMADLAQRLGRRVTVAFYHHGNEFGDQEEVWVRRWAENRELPLVYGRCTEFRAPNGREAFWRQSRYSFFRGLPGAVLTGHQLDDAVEWYLLTALQGEGHYMPYRHDNVIRPMLLTPRSRIQAYAEKHNLTWLEDPSNSQPEFTFRNRIRHNILPEALKVNPGLYSTVARRIRAKIEVDEATEFPSGSHAVADSTVHGVS